MAYVCTHVQDDSLYTPYVEAMFATLSGAGWELHDDVSSTNKVYKSKGESGNYCYGYMQASLEATHYLELRMFQDWNSSTHAGIAGTYYSLSDARVLINSHKPALMYCDKNFLYIWCTYTYPSDNSVTIAGMVSEVYDTTLTTTTTGISSGSHVTIPVMSTDGFLKGARYKLVSTNLEGREIVTIETITDSTSLVVESLTYNYSSDAYLGREPCPIATLYAQTNPDMLYGFGYNSTYSTVDGTGNQTNLSARYDTSAMLTVGYLDPEPGYNLYGLCPCLVIEYSGYCYVGWWTSFFKSPVNPPTPTGYDGIFMNSDLYLLEASSIFTVVSGTTNTVTLDNVSWDINELQNKIIVIAVGNSAGHTREIASNTSDTVTVNVDWDITINADDSIIICDEVYRALGYHSLKEVINGDY